MQLKGSNFNERIFSVEVYKQGGVMFSAIVYPDQVEIFGDGELQDAIFLASIGLFGKVREFWTRDGTFDLTDGVLQA